VLTRQTGAEIVKATGFALWINDNDQGGHRPFGSAAMPQLSTFPFPQFLTFTLGRRARPYARKLWNVHVTGRPESFPIGRSKWRYHIGRVVGRDWTDAIDAALEKFGVDTKGWLECDRARSNGPLDDFEVSEA